MERPASEPAKQLSPPLEGVRVIEIAGGFSAAYCAHLLAGYGADVVRVEGADRPAPGDWTLDADQATYLLPGKERIDLSGGARAMDPARHLERLVSAAELVIVDGVPGRFDIAAWRAGNPQLVAVTISPFGQSGPDRFLPADDLVAFAAGGTMSLTGDPTAAPLVTGGAQALAFAGLHAFTAALSTYYGAVVQGEGDWVDISVQECLASSLELYAPAAAMGEPAALRFGNYHRAVWALYPCADGYGGVFCLERQVPALFKLVGEHLGIDTLEEERFRNPVQRLENDEELSAYILSFMVDHTGDDLARLGAERKIPFGKVRTPAELLSSAALADRAFFDTVLTGHGEVRVPGRPFPGVSWQGGGPLASSPTTSASTSEQTLEQTVSHTVDHTVNEILKRWGRP
ncbi:MAG: CoA transferase [Acidimicrobiales bacterium]